MMDCGTLGKNVDLYGKRSAESCLRRTSPRGFMRSQDSWRASSNGDRRKKRENEPSIT
jgi:hypothetical protein